MLGWRFRDDGDEPRGLLRVIYICDLDRKLHARSARDFIASWLHLNEPHCYCYMERLSTSRFVGTGCCLAQMS